MQPLFALEGRLVANRFDPLVSRSEPSRSTIPLGNADLSPGQVVVDHSFCELQIQSFRRYIGGQEDVWPRSLRSLGWREPGEDVVPRHEARSNSGSIAGAPGRSQRCEPPSQIAHGLAIAGKDQGNPAIAQHVSESSRFPIGLRPPGGLLHETIQSSPVLEHQLPLLFGLR